MVFQKMYDDMRALAREIDGPHYQSFLDAGYWEGRGDGKSYTNLMLSKPICRPGVLLFDLNIWVWGFRSNGIGPAQISYIPEVHFRLGPDNRPTFFVVKQNVGAACKPADVEAFHLDLYDRLGCGPLPDDYLWVTDC